MNLELIPNEILLHLFDYLTILHVFQAFGNLNSRFHTLIFIHCRKVRLDFQNISKTNFDLICRKYLPSFASRILSLRLSNDDRTPQQIGLFLSYGFRLQQFHHLQTIALSFIHSPFILDKLITECSHLPFLTHFTLTNCHISINQTTADRLYNQIWSLPQLTHCHIDINFANRNYFPTPTITSTSLKSLSIPNISCHLNTLTDLVQSTPNLEYLSIVFIDYADQYDVTLPSLSITRLKLSFDCPLNILHYLLRNLPNLYHFTLETCNIYMNGYQWEDLIGNYLPNLQIFRFKMRFSPSNETDRESQLNEILNSFRTKFWIDEHQWFVRGHWYASDEQYRLDFIDLFTLPYIFNEFLSYTGCILAKSTYPYDDAYWSYDRVTELCYGSSHFINSILSRVRFSNIQHLSLSLPFNDQFLSVVSKLDRLTSLYVSINTNKETENIHWQLQLLFDRAVHLNSLSFGSWRSSCLLVPLMDHCSATVHQLNFQGYDGGRHGRYFDDKQCMQLIHSPLGIQCEILLIKVKNRMSVVNLVNQMSSLQALNVRCEDDSWTVDDNSSSSIHDELIEWLRHSLPSSCMVTRDTHRIRDIRLWIR